MTQDMVTDQDSSAEPEEAPTADEKPPFPPGWAAPNPPPAPQGWDPYQPPARVVPVAPTGWDPYAPPARTVPSTPTGWDPYQPPHNGPFGTVGPAGVPVSAPPPVPNGEARPVPADGWVRGASITHLWSASGSPGVWVAIPGIGWRPLSSASGSGHSDLALLALLARTHRLPVAYHEDSRGHIDQLLV